MESWKELIPESIRSRYELHNFNNAVEILIQAYQLEYLEILDALEHIDIRIGDITAAGGNESKIRKRRFKDTFPVIVDCPKMNPSHKPKEGHHGTESEQRGIGILASTDIAV